MLLLNLCLEDGAHIKVLIDNCQQANFKKLTVWLTLKQLVALLANKTRNSLFFRLKSLTLVKLIMLK